MKEKSKSLRANTSECQEKRDIIQADTSIYIENENNMERIEEVLNIELNPSDKNALIKTLTTLAVYVELGLKNNNQNAFKLN